MAEELTHDAHVTYVAHIANACRHCTQFDDPEGGELWTIEKERSDSPFKLDLRWRGA